MAFKKLTTYTDGGARGNPGPAAIGVVIKHGAETIKEFGRYLGETTNNQAEYRALISALEHVAELEAEEVECMLDSELVVKQMRHEYRVKDPDLAPLFLKVYNLSQSFKKISYTHIPREKNKEADAMVNEALDRQMKH